MEGKRGSTEIAGKIFEMGIGDEVGYTGLYGEEQVAKEKIEVQERTDKKA